MSPVGVLNKLRRVRSARWTEQSPATTDRPASKRKEPNDTISPLSSHSTVASSNDSISSLEVGYSPRVRFCTREDIRPVENCLTMSCAEKARTWYNRDELKRIKKESRQTASMIKSEFQQTLLALLRGCHDQAIFIAELGFQVEESSVSSSLLSDMTAWSCSSVEGECCRGVEKTLLRRECEAFAHDARRSVVLDSNSQWGGGDDDDDDDDDDTTNAVAKTYHLLCRHAVVFAKAMADADAAAAARQ